MQKAENYKKGQIYEYSSSKWVEFFGKMCDNILCILESIGKNTKNRFKNRRTVKLTVMIKIMTGRIQL